MRLLLDTSIVLWVAADSPRLSKAARQEIESAEAVFVSSISLWEMVMKAELRKLDVEFDHLLPRTEAAGIHEVAVTWRHTMAVRTLADHHRDPFDRMVIAEAISEPLRLITADVRLRAYSDLVMLV
ncbi:type II toxin-antitoxin system VapC family toxin [Bradyrhizobium sp.]|uniref:type II toxin-antitoxin system VapC family toxin n=1 Tax=Bradyrhizobium sp. TaxID=376 RepID=UPI003C5AE417